MVAELGVIDDEFSPFNDVDMPDDCQDYIAKVDVADAGVTSRSTRYDHVPKTVEELRRICGNSWIQQESLLMSNRKLGEGSYATVVRGIYVQPDGSRVPVAIKKLKPELLSDRDLQDMIIEAAVLSRLRHPCIVKLYGVGSSSTNLLNASSFTVVSEFCDCGSLKDLLHRQMEAPRRRLYSQEDAIGWCLEIARGLRYLHNSVPMIIHRDLKPENVLLTDKKRHAKIADFGLSVLVGPNLEAARSSVLFRLASSWPNESNEGTASSDLPIQQGPSVTPVAPPSHEGEGADLVLEERHYSATQPMRSLTLASFSAATKDFQQTALHACSGQPQTADAFRLTTMTGSLLYMAPEVFQQKPYSEKVDVFAFGKLMFELLSYELTYYALQSRDQVGDLMTYVEQVCVGGHRPAFPPRCPGPIKSLIGRCWAQDPADRPNMNEVVNELQSIADGMGLSLFEHHSTAPLQENCRQEAKRDSTGLQQPSSTGSKVVGGGRINSTHGKGGCQCVVS